MSDAFCLRPVQERDRDAIVRLWLDRFGGREDKVHRWIDAVLNERYRTFGHVAVAATPPDAEGSVVGFGLLEIGTRDYTRSYLGADALGDALERDLNLDDHNGLLHMYCVDRAWEGRGVGTALYRRHLAHFAEQGVRRAFGISWHRPHREGADSRALFEKTGFEAVGKFEEFYARASPRTDCPDCGGDCHCTASIYAKTLGNA